jgi:hypothetical protein
LSGGISSEVILLGCEANDSPSTRAEVKNVWSYTTLKPFLCMAKFVEFVATTLIALEDD